LPSPESLNGVPALLACPHTPAIGQNFVCDARVLFAVLANNGDIRDVNRRFFLDDAAFDIALRIRTRVPLDHLNAFDHDLLVFRYHDENAAGFSAILSAEDEDFVILFDWRYYRH